MQLSKKMIRKKNQFIQQKYALYAVIYIFEKKLRIKKLVFAIIILINALGSKKKYLILM